MKRMTKLCVLLLALGLMLGIGGFAAGGRLYGWDWMCRGALPGPHRGWSGFSFWSWDADDRHRPWDDDRTWDDNDDRSGSGPDAERLPDGGTAGFAEWRKGQNGARPSGRPGDLRFEG